MLSTQAMLHAIGFGASALPISASLNWILKDGLGQACESSCGANMFVSDLNGSWVVWSMRPCLEQGLTMTPSGTDSIRLWLCSSLPCLRFVSFTVYYIALTEKHGRSATLCLKSRLTAHHSY